MLGRGGYIKRVRTFELPLHTWVMWARAGAVSRQLLLHLHTHQKLTSETNSTVGFSREMAPVCGRRQVFVSRELTQRRSAGAGNFPSFVTGHAGPRERAKSRLSAVVAAFIYSIKSSLLYMHGCLLVY